MTTNTFKQFRDSFTKVLDSSKFKITYPSNNGNESFFWITSLGTGIGDELCHYEFVIGENSKINLDIHFEVSSTQDTFFLNKVKCLNKLLGKKMEKKFSDTQVGITYESFKINEINEARNAFLKMDKKFKHRLPFILLYLCFISFFKKR